MKKDEMQYPDNRKGLSGYNLSYDLSGLVTAVEDHCGDKSEQYGSGDPARTGFETACECSDKSVSCDGFADSFGEVIPETGEGNGSSGSRKTGKRLIQPDGAEEYSRNDVSHENTCRSQSGEVDEELSDSTESAACKESP